MLLYATDLLLLRTQRVQQVCTQPRRTCMHVKSRPPLPPTPGLDSVKLLCIEGLTDACASKDSCPSAQLGERLLLRIGLQIIELLLPALFINRRS